MNMQRLIGLVLVVAAFSGGAWGAELLEFRTRNYDVATDMPRLDAKELAAYMDGVYTEYARRFSGFPARNAERVKLYLFGHQDAYIEFMDTKGVNAEHSGGMFFVIDGDAGLATFVYDQPRSRMLHTLQHEGLHQFVYQRIGWGLPVWCNEGMAEYFGAAISVRGRLRVGQFSEQAVDSMKSFVNEGNWIAFEDMLTMSNEEWGTRLMGGDQRTGLMYLQAWSMAHFLIEGSGGRYSRMFEDYLHNIKNGVHARDAFIQAFGTDDFVSFEQAWVRYVQEELEPDPISTAAERLEFLAAGLQKLYEEGVMPESIEQLQKELASRGFGVVTGSHGAVRVLKSTDPEMFQPPTPARRSRNAAITLTAPIASDAPPGIEITGLQYDVFLTWTVDDRGLLHEVVFR